MRRVIVESPYAGDVARNVDYARACLRDSLKRGEAPIAFHLLYTQDNVLRDDDPDERQLGIDAGAEWALTADATVVYTDLGMSPGMEAAVADADDADRAVEYREIGAKQDSAE